jgi:regulator of RNase E activity RraB
MVIAHDKFDVGFEINGAEELLVDSGSIRG